MKKIFLVLFALALVLWVSPVAKASSFDYDYVAAGGGTGKLLFTVNGSNLATGGSFEVQTPFAGLSANTSYAFDTGFQIGSSIFLTFGPVGNQIQLTYISGVWTLYDATDPAGLTLNLTSAPEPSSLLLLGSGLFLLAAGLFWKSKTFRAHQDKNPHSTVVQVA